MDAVAAVDWPRQVTGLAGKLTFGWAKEERKRLKWVDGVHYQNTLNIFHALVLNEKRKHFVPVLWRSPQLGEEYKLRQCWFLGCHSDIGGDREKLSGVSDITLVWTMAQINEWVRFDIPLLWALLRGPRAGDNSSSSSPHSVSVAQ